MTMVRMKGASYEMLKINKKVISMDVSRVAEGCDVGGNGGPEVQDDRAVEV
jgi:hypothetical protein